MNSGQQLYGIYGIWHVPFWQRSLWIKGFFGVAIILILIALYGLAIWILKKTKKPAPFWQQLIQKIAFLEKQYKERSIELPDLYALLTAYIKEFVSVEYQVNMQSKTDEECILFLQDLPLSDTVKQKLEKLLSESAVIKFSFLPISDDQVFHDLAFCSAFIQDSVSHASKSKS